MPRTNESSSENLTEADENMATAIEAYLLARWTDEQIAEHVSGLIQEAKLEISASRG